MFKIIAFLFSALAMATAMKCPKSDASLMHAGCEVTVSFTDSCAVVQTEMLARVNGQYETWHDPHNNGTYTITSNTESEIDAERTTGDKKYTDKMIFSFTSTADGGCEVEACSESQVNSMKDFSTNYCNVHSLYCNDAGCLPMTTLKYTESFGKCSDHDDVCIAS